MITLDLEPLVLNCKLSPWDRATRAEIIQMIGENEATYPDIVGYGNVSFDFGSNSLSARLAGLCIVYPQYIRCWSDDVDERGRLIREWPSRKFEWKLGAFQAEAELDQLTDRLPELSNWRRHDLEILSRPACMIHSLTHRIEIAFLSMGKNAPMRISWIQVFNPHYNDHLFAQVAEVPSQKHREKDAGD